MKVLDPGHGYEMDELDHPKMIRLCQRIWFVKRDSSSNPGKKYPGNVGTHPGVNVQEVLRVLIDRMRYLNNQIPCSENDAIIPYLQECILLLEQRAARVHGRTLQRSEYIENDQIELEPTCKTCGHIQCKEHEEQNE